MKNFYDDNLQTNDSPERNLWIAVIHQAVLDISKNGNRQHRRTALAWVKSKRSDVGSFAWCCRELGFDFNGAKSALLRMAI